MPPQFRLRKPTVADAPFIVWLDTPAVVREHVLMATPPTLEQAENVIERWLTFRDPFGYFIIEFGSDNRPVGWVHAKPCVHLDGAIELGWRLHPDVWGYGIATAAAKQVIAKFRQLDPAVTFTASTLQSIVRSLRVMDRLGMSLHTRYLHADLHPALLYNLEAGINVE